MTDYRVDCPASDADALMASVADFMNVLPVSKVPMAGIAAAAQSTDEFGNIIPAQGAIGDPSRVYVAVRTNRTPVFPSSAVPSNPDVSEKLLGVWAGDDS